MTKEGFFALSVVAVCVLAATPLLATPFKGSLTSDDGGLDGLGVWADPGSTLSWSVEQNLNSSWHYEYTLSVTEKDISHVVVEVSETFTDDDYFNENWHEKDGDPTTDVGDYGTGNGNPDIPSTMHGLKFDETVGTSLTVSFDSFRVPVWGDFYAKDGKEGGPDGDTIQLWNAGLGADETVAPYLDPIAPAASGSIDGLHLLVPDSVDEPGKGSLTIVKFLDTNENGEPDSGEQFLPGWEFSVNGPEVTSVTTGADGTISIALDAGEYEITEINLPDGWQVTTPNPLTGVVILEGQGTTVFFGNIPEPTTMVVLAIGSIGALVRRRRCRA